MKLKASKMKSRGSSSWRNNTCCNLMSTKSQSEILLANNNKITDRRTRYQDWGLIKWERVEIVKVSIIFTKKEIDNYLGNWMECLISLIANPSFSILQRALSTQLPTQITIQALIPLYLEWIIMTLVFHTCFREDCQTWTHHLKQNTQLIL